MKKRIVSLMIVIAMMFSGVFSVIASADTMDIYWKIFETAWDTIKNRNVIQTSDMDNIVNHEDASSDMTLSNWSGSGPFLAIQPGDRVTSYYAYSNVDLVSPDDYFYFVSFASNISFGDYYYFMYRENKGNYDSIHLYGYHHIANSDLIDFTFDDNYGSLHNIYGRADFGTTDYIRLRTTFIVEYGTFRYLGNDYSTRTRIYTSENRGIGSTWDAFSCLSSQSYATNFEINNDELKWSSNFVQNGNELETIVSASSSKSKPIDISGYNIVAGLVYHEYSSGINGFPSSDYFFSERDGSTQVHNNIASCKFKYNLKNLETLRKRKRLDHFNGFYAFCYVTDPDGKEVHYNQQLINFDDVDDGVFSDVEDMPDHDDYVPEPTEYPNFPDVEFQFTPSNDYRTFNYETINNYTYDYGEDLETNISNFYNWTSNSTQTVNNNVSNGFETVNHNINEVFNNVTNYFESTEDFINDGYTAVNDYLGDLIKKFNDDFNNWTEANTKYVGDCFNTLNHNITVIGDNIVNAIKSQLVPDQDVLINIMLSDCDWFKQGYDILKSKTVDSIDTNTGTEKNFVVELPLIGESTFIVDFNSYLSSDYCAPIRTASTIIIYASTFIGALNIIFKIFGLGFGSSGE